MEVRLAAMGEVLDTIAHRWRQPLAAITTTVGTIRDGVALGRMDEAGIIAGLTRIEDLAISLSEMIQEARGVFIPDMEPAMVHIGQLVKKSLSLYGIAEQEPTVRTDFQTISPIRTYPHEMLRVVFALLRRSVGELKAKRATFLEIVLDEVGEGQRLSLVDDGKAPSKEEIENDGDSLDAESEQGNGLLFAKLLVARRFGGVLEITVESGQTHMTLWIPRIRK